MVEETLSIGIEISSPVEEFRNVQGMAAGSLV
jgi:hypothetical protein